MLPLLCPAGPSELHQTPAAQGVCPVTGPWVNLERPPRGPISCIPVKPSGLSPHLVSSSPAVGPWRKGAFLCLEEAQHTCKATGRDELCRAERAAQLQGTIPVRQISFTRPGKATREEQRCRVQKCISRCANNSSDLLPNRTVIYAANLLSHRQTQASAQTLAEKMRGGRKTLWAQHAYEQTHAHNVSVWQWENSYTHKWRLYSWFLQLKSTTTYFLFWLHQTWHFKSLFSGLVVFVLLFFFLFLFSLNSVLFWICFKMNAAFIPIPDS